MSLMHGNEYKKNIKMDVKNKKSAAIELLIFM